MAKAQQDQVSWPYSAPQYYPQPRPYNLSSYPQGRVCQESCCRRMRGPLPYPHHLPPFPPPLPCRPPQDNSYVRPQHSHQMRGFLPVNPYMHPQTHGGHSQPPPPPGLHRPIPQGRYDYSDYYRYGNGGNNNSSTSSINSNNGNSSHQGLHHGVLKQNTNSYSSCNSVLLSDQYPACHYASQEQESALPSLDVRQFLATWQDKDEEVFESDQQKSKGQFQEHAESNDVFKPLDCTKRNDPPLTMYGYNHDQMGSHSTYYNKSLQGLSNHQPVNETAFKNPPYVGSSTYHSLSVDTDCSYSASQVALTDAQHVSYERRIEKIFNPHRCNVLPDAQNHCGVEKNNSEMNMKAQTSNDKSHYHLSASLECEDLFDDINKRKDDRQRNIVHPLCYQDNFAQCSNGNIRKKLDIPHVSVKSNTAVVDYSQSNHVTNNTLTHESASKKLKVPPLKKWVQKQKKSDEELFSSFNMTDHTVDFCEREHVIGQNNEPGLNLNVNGSNVASLGISHVLPDVSLEDNFQSYTNTITESEKPVIECLYSSSSSVFAEPGPPVEDLTAAIEPLPISSEKSMLSSAKAPSVGCDADNITSSCDLVVAGKQCTDKVADVPPSKIRGNVSVVQNFQYPVEQNCDFLSCQRKGNESSEKTTAGEVDDRLREVLKKPETSTNSPFEAKDSIYSETESIPETSVKLTSQTGVETPAKTAVSKLRQTCGHVRLSTVRRKRAFSLLTFWRNRNRLLRKCISVKKTFSNDYKSKCSFSQNSTEASSVQCGKKRKNIGISFSLDSKPPQVDKDQELEVNVVLTSIVEGVCQIGEVSSQVDDILASVDSEPAFLYSPLTTDKADIQKVDGNSNVVGWKSTPCDEKVSSTVESDVTEEDDSNLVLCDDFIKYTEGSVIDGPGDRVLHGILNWPHNEEEITSNNEKESIKVSLPWVKIFEPHSKLPDDEKTLDIGPARIELRYSPAPVEYQPGHYTLSKNFGEKKSSIFSVKKVLLKHNRGSSIERIPKMVIKKTGCEEYKSYIKDAKLRVVSIKNSNKDGQAEVIIEADRPLIDSLRNDEICQTINDSSREIKSSGATQLSDVHAELKIAEESTDSIKELHHCLLCQESFTSLDKLHNHENSLSHRHIDIVQRNVLQKIQESISGVDVPPFQPLSATEIDYLNWRPNFPGYNHFYHNVPL